MGQRGEKRKKRDDEEEKREGAYGEICFLVSRRPCVHLNVFNGAIIAECFDASRSVKSSIDRY